MRRRQRQLSLKECYGILKIEKGADLDALKKAYRRRAFELHPDLNPDAPDAGRQFQFLNEAYVILSAVLGPTDASERKSEKRGDREDKRDAENPSDERRDDAQGKEETWKTRSGQETRNAGTRCGNNESAAGEAGQKPENGTREDAETRDNGFNGNDAGEEGGRRQSAKAAEAYAEQDVLRDLLNDPFARRVFEDIYSELNRQQVNRQQEPQKNPDPVSPPQDSPDRQGAKIRRNNPAWNASGWNANPDKGGKGVAGVVKDWLRRQIDEEQTLNLPAVRLTPGRRLRLQIRQGLSDELRTVEITLPPDFAVGKPVRLRGLGRRIGPWQGDLYLTLYNE